jgi:hypothetical protein
VSERREPSPPSAADVDQRLPKGVAPVVARGETCWLCEHPRALPAPDAAPADWVVLPLAFAWLYPDSLLIADALPFARRGLILYGGLDEPSDPAPAGDACAVAAGAGEGPMARRLRALLGSLGLSMTQVGAVVVARRRPETPDPPRPRDGARD